MNRHTRKAAAAAAIATALAVTIGASAAPQAKQRIAIEEVVGKQTARTGTFTLVPLTPGPLKRDSGTFFFQIKAAPTVVRAGQRVTKYTGVDELTGKRGTFRISNVFTTSRAGGGNVIGTATWSAARGTKAYAGLSGGGRGSAVATPRGFIFTRYEGYVSTG